MTVPYRPPNNPFATRWVRPSAIEYFFPDGQSDESLVERLEENGWWGQIIGPHGSGKSSLLAALIPVIESAGRRPLVIALHDSERRLPHDFVLESWTSATQIVIDGYEQLSHRSRFALKRRCRRAGCGLLVTAHASVGLKELIHLKPGLNIATRLVETLMGPEDPLITAGDVAASYHARGANVREMLFDFYNLYERRRRDLRN